MLGQDIFIGFDAEQFAEFARRASATAGQERIGGISKLSQEEVVEIYKLAY